jgi:hypothetical protein
MREIAEKGCKRVREDIQSSSEHAKDETKTLLSPPSLLLINRRRNDETASPTATSSRSPCIE